MIYRTRTYIAADWDSDSNAVEQLNKWNDSNYFSYRLLMLTTYSRHVTIVLIVASRVLSLQGLMRLRHLFLLLEIIQKQ